MAPKAKAPVKATKATSATAKPKGLQLSAAQWKAYNAAYTAYATAAYRTLAAAQRRAAISAAALSLRKARLSAAYSIGKKAAAAHAVARTAAIAAFATKQSYRQSQLSHQNAALQQRVFADYERHLRAAARAQYVYKGEKAYAHHAVMATLTTAQAQTIMEAKFAQAAKTAKAAVRSAKPKATSPSPAVAAIQAGARAAGLAAAQGVPASQQSAAVRARAKAKAHATAHATASKTAKATAAANRAARKKGTAKAPKTSRTAPRGAYRDVALSTNCHGSPDGYDCVAAAIAGSCQLDTGHRLTDAEYQLLVTGLGAEPSIGFALSEAVRAGEAGLVPRLLGYRPAPLDLGGTGLVIGFQAERGAHAALYLGAGVILSWGELLPLEDVMLPGSEVEECWDLTWA